MGRAENLNYAGRQRRQREGHITVVTVTSSPGWGHTLPHIAGPLPWQSEAKSRLLLQRLQTRPPSSVHDRLLSFGHIGHIIHSPYITLSYSVLVRMSFFMSNARRGPKEEARYRREVRKKCLLIISNKNWLWTDFVGHRNIIFFNCFTLFELLC